MRKKDQRIPTVGIKAWLTGSREGKRILNEAVQEALPQAIEEHCEKCKHARRIPVLIVMDSTGTIEVYSNKKVMVHIEQLIDCERKLAEAYMESRLPKWASDVFWPVYYKTTAAPRKVSVKDEQGRLLNVAVIKGIAEFAEEAKRSMQF